MTFCIVAVQIPANRLQWLNLYGAKTQQYNTTYFNIYHRVPPTQLDHKFINSMAITTPARIAADFGNNPNVGRFFHKNYNSFSVCLHFRDEIYGAILGIKFTIIEVTKEQILNFRIVGMFLSVLH